jgi:hypothetical protein
LLSVFCLALLRTATLAVLHCESQHSFILYRWVSLYADIEFLKVVMQQRVKWEVHRPLTECLEEGVGNYMTESKWLGKSGRLPHSSLGIHDSFYRSCGYVINASHYTEMKLRVSKPCITRITCTTEMFIENIDNSCLVVISSLTDYSLWRTLWNHILNIQIM